MQTVKRTGRLGLVLHPRNEPTPVVEKLTSWARSHGSSARCGSSRSGRCPSSA